MSVPPPRNLASLVDGAQPADCPFPTPERRKPLSVRRAETKARRAQAWGEWVERATQEGAQAVAEVQFDWTRAAFARLPDGAQHRAWEALAEAIARVREEHAQ